MRIGGLQRLSLVDFPKKLAAIVFTVGCNFRCPFCHNPELVTGGANEFLEAEFFDFLAQRTQQLEGVVITGGEPTLHHDLPEFVKKIRALGYAVKLDTNGTAPEMLQQLIDQKLLDYVAMDIKHTWVRYPFATGLQQLPIANIQRSAAILLQNKVDYEFRTTVIREFHNPEDIVTMAQQITGAKRYIVQEFIPDRTLDPTFGRKLSFERATLEGLAPEVQHYVQTFEIRQ
ncbi:MAG: anaerobic ribonucleoside-triphosphate reductase activating protein [Opitutales bacterium]|nr:anaerobic ribonucleoside-triphosphate reductase activating protein [Opitutales bacterium]